MRLAIAGLLALLLASAEVGAEEIKYSIYSIPLFGDKPNLVAGGKKVYLLTEVTVAKGPSPDEQNWKKSIAVTSGFELGASIYRSRQVDGFGMWIQKDGGGFSWEWFDRVGPETFRKRQGAGLLKVRLVRGEAFEEVAEINFLTDVTMRLNTRWFIPFLDKETDQIVIKTGSVFRLAP
ncbi:hypothetical protein [Piscinibacter sp. HJYY11]|uniref:hypothetical protein n=1 Tax=Piscinibacter sp. HJYY11 TaxID=2801333 RepID=UPI00191D5F23|nr:hypothetical protein [Piscinibacter sp. HJYY11]MBL0729660.1 hypothetical protein [Piscinibacter sp. HJYY11]